MNGFIKNNLVYIIIYFCKENKWAQHNDPVICLPQHISLIGVYTGQIFLVVAAISYVVNFHSLVPVALILWTTTTLHWLKVQRFGLIKIIDIVAVIASMAYVSFYASYRFFPHHRTCWFIVMWFVILVYLVNSVIFYCQTNNHNIAPMQTSNYNYFSLGYTEPFTALRESCYYITTIVHTSTLHLFIGAWLCLFIANSVKTY